MAEAKIKHVEETGGFILELDDNLGFVLSDALRRHQDYWFKRVNELRSRQPYHNVMEQTDNAEELEELWFACDQLKDAATLLKMVNHGLHMGDFDLAYLRG